MERNFAEIGKKNVFTAVGLMSGTSLDGVDVALIQTDGEAFLKRGTAQTFPYPDSLRESIRSLLGQDPDSLEGQKIEFQMTHFHAEAVHAFFSAIREKSLGDFPVVDVIGFHGHTLWHRPPARHGKLHPFDFPPGSTCQIGDGALLAQLTGIPVVNQFRQADMAAGGQGAPLVPLYHKILAKDLEKPVLCVNVGGISNVTWIGPDPSSSEETIRAFDCGPGGSLLDLWMQTKAGLPFDPEGAYSGRGTPRLFDALLKPWHFEEPPPKSFDRQDSLLAHLEGLSVEDGAATLTHLTQEGILRSFPFFPSPPRTVVIMGGGRHNRTLVAGLQKILGAHVRVAEDLGWDGDAIEAEAFGFLAVRFLKKLPTSLPSTTGVSHPICGGLFHGPPTAGPLT